jgi:predicted amidohydrolase
MEAKMEKKEIKVAAVATFSYRGDDEYQNAEMAVNYASEAASKGAQLICFPEGYPGPCTGPMDSGGRLSTTPIEIMCDAAKKLGVYISCGNFEESETVTDAYYLCHKLISPQGVVMANYKRCQPTSPVINDYLYNGRTNMLAGDRPIVVNTELGKIGLIICSELYVPELARIEMLMGAEILLDPIGGTNTPTRTQIYETEGTVRKGSKMELWQCIARARAAENIMFVIGTANVFYAGSPWGSFIVSPESILAASEGEGIIHAVLEMDRLHYLRETYYEDGELGPPPDDPSTYRPLMCLPAQHRDRRPSLYSKLIEP